MRYDSIFEDDGFEQIDDYIWEFHNCVLKRDMRPYSAGDTVPVILIDFEDMEIIGYAEEEMFRYKVELCVV